MSETVFTYAAPALKFGRGASSEVGQDLLSYGARRILHVTDAGVAATGHTARIAEQITARGLHVTTYDRVRLDERGDRIRARCRSVRRHRGGRGRLVDRHRQGGANPIADMWSEKALSMLAGAFRTAVRDGSDGLAREQMAMATTFAGLGFGNAGVHIPHANAYPIAGRVRDFRLNGYPADEPIVPHGMAVSLTAPEAFRFTFEAAPERHLHAARLLDPTLSTASGDGPDVLPAVLSALMRDIGIPNGLAEVGYGDSDVDDLVTGALQQQRLLATSPRPVTGEDLATVFRASMEHW